MVKVFRQQSNDREALLSDNTLNWCPCDRIAERLRCTGVRIGGRCGEAHEAAVDCARRAIRREPEYALAHYILAIALAHLGRMEEARQALQDCETASPGIVETRRDWRPYINEASNDRLHDSIRKIALQTRPRS